MRFTKGVLLFLLLLLAPAISAQSSTYKSDFVVDGCTLGDSGLAIGACSKDGRHFCQESSEKGARPVLLNTLIDQKGCTFGANTPGPTQCCPSGYVCNGTALKCVQRVANCGSWSDETTCKSNSCTWIDRGGGNGVCVDRPTDYSCSVYTSKAACDRDVWNLGSNGIGTDVCGTTYEARYNGNDKGYVTTASSCGCVWDSNTCKLKYEVADDLYNANVAPRDSIECLKIVNAGACVSGSQEVNWTVTTRSQIGFGHSDLPNVLGAGQCEPGRGTRNCGEPVFKLPGFSPLAFAFAVTLLITYYSFFLVRKE